MAYRPLLRTIDQGTGDNVGTWGDNIDDTFTILEEAIAGETAISTTGGDTTLTTANNATDQQRKMIIRVTGTLVSNANIIVPTTNKTYDVINATSGAYTVTIKVSGQTGVAVPQGGAVRVAVTAAAGDCEMIARRDPSNDFEAADRTKLDGIASGAEVNVPTNLTYTAGTRTLNSSTGANVVLPIADGSNAGLAPVFDVSDALKVLRVSASGGPEFATVSVGGGDMFISTYDPGSVAEQLVGLTATQTLTNKTLGATTVTGLLTLTPSGNAILVQEGGGTGVGAANEADNIVIDSTGDAGMTILTGDSSTGSIFFGRASGSQTTRGGMKYDFANDYLFFESGGVNALYIDATGQVGIGESAPSDPLHVTADNAYIRVEDSDGVLGGALSAGLFTYAQGNIQSAIGNIGTSDGRLSVRNYQGDVYIQADQNNAKSSSAIYFDVDNLRMGQWDGQTGFGAAPSHLKVGVDDNRRGIISVYGANDGNGATINLYQGASDDSSTTEYVTLQADVSGLYLKQSNGDEMAFANTNNWYLKTADTNRLYINSTGQIGIGTTSPASGALVHINGDGTPTGLLVQDVSDPTIALTDGSTGMRLAYEETAESLRIQKSSSTGAFVSEVAWFNADQSIRFQGLTNGFLKADSNGDLTTARTGWVAHSSNNMILTGAATRDFTSIPAGIRRFKVVYYKASHTSGTLYHFIQLGTGSPGIVSTGNLYQVTVQDSSGASTSQNDARNSQGFAASYTISGMMEFERMGSSNSWTVMGATKLYSSAGAGGIWSVAGYIDLGAELTTVRYGNSGANTFDGGSVSLYYDYGE